MIVNLEYSAEIGPFARSARSFMHPEMTALDYCTYRSVLNKVNIMCHVEESPVQPMIKNRTSASCPPFCVGKRLSWGERRKASKLPEEIQS